jgi:hypothetical protein
MVQKYIIDISSLRRLKDNYPPDLKEFNFVWINVERLIKRGELLSNEVVLREITRGKRDWLRLVFVKKYKKLFKINNKKTILKVKELINQDASTGLLVKKKDIYDQKEVADPYIVAQALVSSEGALIPPYQIVTEDGDMSNFVRKNYPNLTCLNALDFLKEILS